MKISFAFLILSLSFLMPLTPFVRAQQPMHGRRMGSGQDLPPCWLPEDLHLTAEQIQKLKSIQDSYVRSIESLRADLLNSKYVLRNLISDPTSEAGEIKEKREEILALENQIQMRVLDYQSKVRKILTPQQFRVWNSGYQLDSGQGIRRRFRMNRMYMERDEFSGVRR